MNILVIGDAPNLPTGLGRIARDICKLAQGYGHRVAQLGLGYNGEPQQWWCFSALDIENWAADDVGRVWQWFFGDEGGVILTIWDPVRCYSISQLKLPLGIERWGYFAVDGHNKDGKLGLIAEKTFQKYDRLLAYTAYGAEIISNVVGGSVQWLPHLLGDEFKPAEVGDRVLAEGKERRKVGAVASNQPRKHWPTVFKVFQYMQLIRPDVEFWIHTDKVANHAWVFAELAAAYGIKKGKLEITVGELSDEEMAQRYNECLFTVAPGLGEGFGYPIVESLGCGVPVMAYDYAGGAELVPVEEWLIKPAMLQERDIYLVQRPVAEDVEVIRAAKACFDSTSQERGEHCVASVRHLRWDALAPRWASWLGSRKEE